MLSLPFRLYDIIVGHAERERPAEACGILGGQFGSAHSAVESAHEATNVADRPETRYAIDPTEHLEIMKRIREADQDVVGFYHSHPSGPSEPSETDGSRATWSDRSYVIVTLDSPPFVNSWRWNGSDERFEQESLTIAAGEEETVD